MQVLVVIIVTDISALEIIFKLWLAHINTICLHFFVFLWHSLCKKFLHSEWRPEEDMAKLIEPNTWIGPCQDSTEG